MTCNLVTIRLATGFWFLKAHNWNISSSIFVLLRQYQGGSGVVAPASGGDGGGAGVGVLIGALVDLSELLRALEEYVRHES